MEFGRSWSKMLYKTQTASKIVKKELERKMSGGFSITIRKVRVKMKLKLEKKELKGENFNGVQCLMKLRILQRTEHNDTYFIFDINGRR